MTEMLQQFRADVKEDIKAALKPLEERFSRLERTLKQWCVDIQPCRTWTDVEQHK